MGARRKEIEEAALNDAFVNELISIDYHENHSPNAHRVSTIKSPYDWETILESGVLALCKRVREQQKMICDLTVTQTYPKGVYVPDLKIKRLEETQNDK